MRVQKATLFFIGFVLVAGCSGQSSQKTDAETADPNAPIPQATDNLNESITQAMQIRQLQAVSIDALPSSPPGAPLPGEAEATKWQSKAVGQQGQLLQSEEKANVIFAGSRCMRGDSCGCSREMKYFFAKASNGHIAILAPKPNVHTRTVIRPGPCGYGCGQPSPPQPSAYYELPVNDMTLVEFIEVPFEIWDVVVTCENPIPRP